MKILFSTFLLLGFSLKIIGSEPLDASPYKDFRIAPDTTAAMTRQHEAELDNSIHAFLKKEGMLNIKAEHPFSTPKTEFFQPYFKSKDAEAVFMRMEKSNQLRNDILLHVKDIKTITHAQKQRGKGRYQLQPILLSSQ